MVCKEYKIHPQMLVKSAIRQPMRLLWWRIIAWVDAVHAGWTTCFWTVSNIVWQGWVWFVFPPLPLYSYILFICLSKYFTKENSEPSAKVINPNLEEISYLESSSRTSTKESFLGASPVPQNPGPLLRGTAEHAQPLLFMVFLGCTNDSSGFCWWTWCLRNWNKYCGMFANFRITCLLSLIYGVFVFVSQLCLTNNFMIGF